MMNYTGSFIARERLARNWSQQGLCRGICSVSYLSKIESGRAEPSEEILNLLFERMGISHNAAEERRVRTLCDEGCEALFSADYSKLESLLPTELSSESFYGESGFCLELLRRISDSSRIPLDDEYEKYMDKRSLGIQRMLQGRAEEALSILGNAYAYFNAGADAYTKGDYFSAAELLGIAYDRAAVEGRVKLMMLCKLFLGACCANRTDVEGMERHNAVARRLAEALGDREALSQMEYNAAATAIECGRYEEAYAYFSSLVQPDMMSLHKLAIACEKTGREREALAALDRAEGMSCDYPPEDLAELMCRVVRCRLEHKNYVNHAEYGEMLLELFERCEKELSMGYALFHLPWVLEWHKACRQYKKALELMEKFRK